MEAARVLGRRRPVYGVEGRQDRAVHVAVTKARNHVVVEDRLAVGVAHKRRLEAGTRVQLGLAVALRIVEVQQDHQ